MIFLRNDILRALTLVSLLFPVPATAQGDVPPPSTGGPSESVGQEGGDSSARLKQAAGLLEALKGVRGAPRLEGMRKAARAYVDVAQDFAGQASVAARARYEAGECFRKAGDLEPAAEQFSLCLEVDDGRYLQRAAFGLADMQRRQEGYEAAIGNYRKAVEASPDSARADESRLWVARCYEAWDKPEEALAAYRDAVANASSPRRKVDACDRLAMHLIKRGDFEGAGEAIREAETSAAAILGTPGQDADRMRKALDGMTSRRALQRARDKANDASGDAIGLEQARSGG